MAANQLGWYGSHIVETPKNEGDRIFWKGRCYTVNGDGGWDETSPAPVAHPNAGPAMPIHAQHAGLGIWMVAGAISLTLFLFGGHGLGWF